MLNFNKNDSNGQSNIPQSSSDPSDDPNQPDIPQPGGIDDAQPHIKPTEDELKAVTGGGVAGVAGELTEAAVKELQLRGITKEQIIMLAAAWGVSHMQAAGIALGRTTANWLNRSFGRIFGGGRGGGDGIPAFTFSGPNSTDGGSGPSGPGGTGGGGKGVGSGGSAYIHPQLHNHLDSNAKPGEVEINIGLEARTYVPYFKEYVSNYTSPLHITCAIPQMPTLETYTLGRFNNKAILLRFIEQVARSVSQNLDVNTLNTTNLNAYFNRILTGLSYYYWYESIYTYSMGKVDTNDALVYLRRAMTPDVVNNLMILRSTLVSLPIPPNMVQFVYWMYQNWQVHSLADSPVIKICPFPISQTTNLPDPSDLTTCIDDLNSSTNRAITSVLIKAFDEWFQMDLPPSSLTLEHSADFTTLWANLPSVNIQTAGTTYSWRHPGVPNTTTNVPYHTYTDELEGAIIGMLSIYDNTNSQWAPSLMSPVNSVWGTLTQNRFCWTGTTTKLQGIYDKPTISIQRPETTKYFPTFNTGGIALGPTTVCHDPFAERLYGINIDSVSEIAMPLLQWMLGFRDYRNVGSSFGPVSPLAPRGKQLSSSSNPNKRKWTTPKQDSKPKSNTIQGDEL